MTRGRRHCKCSHVRDVSPKRTDSQVKTSLAVTEPALTSSRLRCPRTIRELASINQYFVMHPDSRLRKCPPLLPNPKHAAPAKTVHRAKWLIFQNNDFAFTEFNVNYVEDGVSARTKSGGEKNLLMSPEHLTYPSEYLWDEVPPSTTLLKG